MPTIFGHETAPLFERRIVLRHAKLPNCELRCYRRKAAALRRQRVYGRSSY